MSDLRNEGAVVGVEAGVVTETFKKRPIDPEIQMWHNAIEKHQFLELFAHFKEV